MNRCPITYQECGENKYSPNGLQLLSPRLVELNDIEFTQEELIRESALRVNKSSIPGVQPKLSAKLNTSKSKFEIVDQHGNFILKPQNFLYPQLPQNEDLTMSLASAIKIEVPFHGMVYSKDGGLVYFVERFDRSGKSTKLAVEDFAQLAGKSRDTKYDYSMEKVATLIDKYCTFPAIEKIKLFKLSLFNFLVGNEDMHLKNYSLINREDKYELSPAYDLLNTTIAIPNPLEEFAFPLRGKKRKLNRQDLIEYWGKDRLGLPTKIISNTIDQIHDAFDIWYNLIEISFLSQSMKDKYHSLLEKRKCILI